MRRDSGQSDGDASAMVLFYLFCLAVRGYSVFRAADGEFFIQKRQGESDTEEE